MSTHLWNPLAQGNISDPYAMYKALREQDPVHLAQTGEYIVTRYATIKAILKNPAFESGNRLVWLKKGIRYFETKQEDFKAIYEAMNAFILMLNGAQHARIRGFISQAWDNRRVDDLIQANISTVAGRLRGKEFDFVEDYAQPIPVLNIAAILGIPVTDYQHLMQLGVAMTKTLDLYVSFKELVMMNDAAAEFIAYFRAQVKAKTDKPDAGLFSRLIEMNRQWHAGLSDEELISIGIFLFTAGEETSAGLISSAMLHLARHAEQLQLLRRDPGLIDMAIDEVLRYDSVVQLLGRTAKDDCMIGNIPVRAGAALTLVIGSGNRDPEAFPDPDEFLLTRKPNRHLSFGSGAHYCLGDWLGRRQSQLSINAFLRQFQHIDVPEQQHSWYKNIAVRRLDRLMVRVG